MIATHLSPGVFQVLLRSYDSKIKPYVDSVVQCVREHGRNHLDSTALHKQVQLHFLLLGPSWHSGWDVRVWQRESMPFTH